jgi:hypothetical protein
MRLCISTFIVSAADFNEFSQSSLKLSSVEAIKAAVSDVLVCASLASCRACNRTLKRGLSGPIFIENVSFQAEAFARIRVKRRDVILACARNFEPRRLQAADDAAAVLNGTGFDAVEQPVVYDLARLAAPGVFDQADSVARPLGG